MASSPESAVDEAWVLARLQVKEGRVVLPASRVLRRYRWQAVFVTLLVFVAIGVGGLALLSLQWTTLFLYVLSGLALLTTLGVYWTVQELEVRKTLKVGVKGPLVYRFQRGVLQLTLNEEVIFEQRIRAFGWSFHRGELLGRLVAKELSCELSVVYEESDKQKHERARQDTEQRVTHSYQQKVRSNQRAHPLLHQAAAVEPESLLVMLDRSEVTIKRTLVFDSRGLAVDGLHLRWGEIEQFSVEYGVHATNELTWARLSCFVHGEEVLLLNNNDRNQPELVGNMSWLVAELESQRRRAPHFELDHHREVPRELLSLLKEEVKTST